MMDKDYVDRIETLQTEITRHIRCAERGIRNRSYEVALRARGRLDAYRGVREHLRRIHRHER